MELFVQVVADGLVAGGLYALIALGMTIMYGVMRIINFAHGELLMVGLYTAFILTGTALGWVSIVVVPVVMLAVGALLFLLIRPVLDKPELSQVMLTVGLSIVLINGAQRIFGADPRILPASNWSPVEIGPIVLESRHVQSLLVSVVVVVAVYFVLVHSHMGRSLRAASESVETAELTGLNGNRLLMISVVIGTGLLGVAAYLALPLYNVSPTVGSPFTLIGFVVIILGGLGDALGTLVAAFAVGLIESLGDTYLAFGSSGLLLYVLLFAGLVLRPKGILNRGRAA